MQHLWARDVGLTSCLHDALAYTLSTGCRYWCMIFWLLMSRGFCIVCGFCPAAALLWQLLLIKTIFCGADCVSVCADSRITHAERLQDWARSDCMHSQVNCGTPISPTGANDMYMTDKNNNMLFASRCHKPVTNEMARCKSWQSNVWCVSTTHARNIAGLHRAACLAYTLTHT